ncbi:SDR family oxidoreductase [Acidiluteibacter ferrifornacis]|uniref:SDR family oxidoreductase n=1 Tax=Acidiluteibacter ferrifornacis TaxID=2692424 RepID=A0A6N9NJE5_9FLAO|nr:SDR family oxidoreductase [Acidiluteibacter ferrifornacis]MBR9831631.1 SDR family oxidoreductase [bacterium]NBG65982.1 SDR family oxidoreductase [Acidiluteibacter ferrifornacis]
MKDKVVIVTGATSGIGKATAEHFGLNGSKVAIVARNADNVESTLKTFLSKGINCVGIVADVGLKSDCERIVNETVAAYGTVDVLVNNAGISMRALFIDADISVIERLMQVNFWGTVYTTKYALPYILKNKGSIVGVSSVGGLIGLPARTGYSASKYAMQGFLNSLRTENKKTGLHVMVACPGFTSSNIRNTALTADGSPQGKSPREEGKMMSAEKVADYIYKGVVKRKRTVTMTLDGLLVRGLSRIFPKLFERAVYNTMAKEPDSPFEKLD